jgi:Mg/Co/Ni transporter MgtE
MMAGTGQGRGRLAGTGIPVLLKNGRRTALASQVFVTTVTDVGWLLRFLACRVMLL